MEINVSMFVESCLLSV